MCGEFRKDRITIRKGVKSVSYIVQNMRIKTLMQNKNFKKDVLVLAL